MVETKQTLIRKTLINSFYSLVGSVLSLLVTIFAAGYSIRVLGEEIAGLIMLSQSILGFSGAIFNFGLGVAVIKYVSEAFSVQDKDKMKDVISTTSFVNFTLGLLIAAFFCIFSVKIVELSKISLQFRDEAVVSFCLFAASFAVNFAMNSYQAVPSALQRYDYHNFYATFQSASTGIVQVIILIKYPSLKNLAIGVLFTTICQALLIVMIQSRLFGAVYFPRWSYRTFRKMFNFSFVVFTTQCGYMVRDNIDRWVLTGLKGSSILPGYVVGQSILSRVRSLIANTVHFIFPMFSDNSQTMTNYQLFSIYDKLHWVISTVGSCSFCIISLNAYWIFHFWIGKSFAENYTILLQLACLQGILGVFSIVPHYVSFGMNKPTNNLIESLLSGLLITIFAIILLPVYGVLGASSAQIIAYIIVVIVIHVNLRKNVFPEQKLEKVFSPIYNGFLIGIITVAGSSYLNFISFYDDFSINKLIMVNFGFLLLVLSYFLYEKFWKSDSSRLDVLMYGMSLLKDTIKERFV